MRSDYLYHMAAGFIAGLILSLIIGIFSYEWMFVSIIGVALLGIGKEWIWDKLLGRGTPEWKDFYFTVYGGLAGVVIAYLVKMKCYY